MIECIQLTCFCNKISMLNFFENIFRHTVLKRPSIITCYNVILHTEVVIYCKLALMGFSPYFGGTYIHWTFHELEILFAMFERTFPPQATQQEGYLEVSSLWVN